MAHDKAVTVALVGAGQRGSDVYGSYILQHPRAARIVAVAEPDRQRRAAVAQAHSISPSMQFSSWTELLARGRLAEAVIVATPDRMHAEPALMALACGYHLLLEKPIATSREELLRLREAAGCSSGSVTVAHVLRYAPFFSTVKHLLDTETIGRLMSILHVENIGYWHFAHSYVRGNWRRAEAASPLILAKACHDLDLLGWFTGRSCRSVSSWGQLTYFRPDNAPQGAGQRCTDPCPLERTCPYSAVEIYLRRFGNEPGWPAAVVFPTPGDRQAVLERSPYGRCVFQCDNDVPDQQMVIMEFGGGIAATLIISAFTAENTRTIKLMGSHGEIRGHLARGEITVLPFSSDPPSLIRTPTSGGHAGGDERLLEAFLHWVRQARMGPGKPPLTSLEESLASHFWALAAEEARFTGRTVELEEWVPRTPA
jgi:predicted dehydrogenase